MSIVISRISYHSLEIYNMYGSRDSYYRRVVSLLLPEECARTHDQNIQIYLVNVLDLSSDACSELQPSIVVMPLSLGGLGR